MGLLISGKYGVIITYERGYENGFCKYLGKSDYQLPSTSLLWLGCKECNIGYSIIT